MKLNINLRINNLTIIIAKHLTYSSTRKISCPLCLFNIMFISYLKLFLYRHCFFFLCSSICYVFLLTPLSHMYYSLQSQLLFLNKLHSFCSRTLFIYHNSNSDRFFPQNYFFGFIRFEEECSKIHRTFFFLDTLRGCVSKQLTPKVSDHCCFEIVKEIAYRESRLQKHS